jgi:hypothetical protein
MHVCTQDYLSCADCYKGKTGVRTTFKHTILYAKRIAGNTYVLFKFICIKMSLCFAWAFIVRPVYVALDRMKLNGSSSDSVLHQDDDKPKLSAFAICWNCKYGLTGL